jgi:hypothetical protein
MFVAIGDVRQTMSLLKQSHLLVRNACDLSSDVDTRCVFNAVGVTQRHGDLHQKAARRETPLSPWRCASAKESKASERR